MNFVILGAGPAGIHAVEAIRKLDQHDSITLISKEEIFLGNLPSHPVSQHYRGEG